MQDIYNLNRITIKSTWTKKGTAEIPTSVVTFGAEKSVSNSTKVTAEIKDLSSWVDPTTIKGLSGSDKVDITKKYILDTSTFKLE